MVISLYAALLAFMLVWLSINVIKGRRLFGAAAGDAGEVELRQRIRAHANFAEYAPLFVILCALAEYNGLPFYAVHLLGVAFLAGRIMHAYSLLKFEKFIDGKLSANPIWRIRGMVCTFTVIGALGAILLVQFSGLWKAL